MPVNRPDTNIPPADYIHRLYRIACREECVAVDRLMGIQHNLGLENVQKLKEMSDALGIKKYEADSLKIAGGSVPVPAFYRKVPKQTIGSLMLNTSLPAPAKAVVLKRLREEEEEQHGEADGVAEYGDNGQPEETPSAVTFLDNGLDIEKKQ